MLRGLERRAEVPLGLDEIADRDLREAQLPGGARGVDQAVRLLEERERPIGLSLAAEVVALGDQGLDFGGLGVDRADLEARQDDARDDSGERPCATTPRPPPKIAPHRCARVDTTKPVFVEEFWAIAVDVCTASSQTSFSPGAA
jgi:hypothetical protein